MQKTEHGASRAEADRREILDLTKAIHAVTAPRQDPDDVKATRHEELGNEAPTAITPRAVVGLARRIVRLLRGRSSRDKR